MWNSKNFCLLYRAVGQVKGYGRRLAIKRSWVRVPVTDSKRKRFKKLVLFSHLLATRFDLPGSVCGWEKQLDKVTLKEIDCRDNWKLKVQLSFGFDNTSVWATHTRSITIKDSIYDNFYSSLFCVFCPVTIKI